MWIGIQRNTNPAMSIGRREIVPIGPGVAADYPNRTGSPPLNPPKRIVRALRRFNSKL